MKNGGQIPWGATAICETYKISCLMVRHLVNGDSTNHSKVQQFRLVLRQISPITLFLLKTCRDRISSAQKSCQENSLDMCWGGIWKGDIMVADIEELEKMNAPKW